MPESVIRYQRDLQKSLQTRLSEPGTIAGNHLFSAAWCGYCRQAKAYLAEKKIPYRELNIDTPEGKHAFAEHGGGGGIPVLLANGERVQGFSRAAYDGLFAKRK